jgi:Spy/CpxP family protein refolding chaperone
MTPACSWSKVENRTRPASVYRDSSSDKGDKLMKKSLIAASALVLVAAAGIAAPHEGHRFGGKHGRHAFAQKFAEELGLTDAQKAQMKEIHKATREANAAFFDSFRGTMRQFREARKAGDQARADSLKATLQSQREQMQSIRAEERAKIKAILTAEQAAKFDELQAKRGERRERGRWQRQ